MKAPFNLIWGDRSKGGGKRCKVFIGNPETHEAIFLPIREDLRNHSPDGFEWGYEGSGPAQLALAICAATIGDRIATKVYQEFKREVVARIKADHFELPIADIKQTIAGILARMNEASVKNESAAG